MELENSRVLASITVGEYKEMIGQILDEKVTPKEAPHVMGHGIKCIMEHFGVSKTTAQGLKDGCLKDAVMQNGRKILVDLTLAEKLYDIRNYNRKTGVYGN